VVRDEKLEAMLCPLGLGGVQCDSCWSEVRGGT
jgi:hypothetical protein